VPPPEVVVVPLPDVVVVPPPVVVVVPPPEVVAVPPPPFPPFVFSGPTVPPDVSGPVRPPLSIRRTMRPPRAVALRTGVFLAFAFDEDATRLAASADRPWPPHPAAVIERAIASERARVRWEGRNACNQAVIDLPAGALKLAPDPRTTG
jgi:hypothetical protein